MVKFLTSWADQTLISCWWHQKYGKNQALNIKFKQFDSECFNDDL